MISSDGDRTLIGGFDTFEVKLGDELRGERATLGKSLLDVQRDLRIKAAYIAAIENCDLQVFPNQGFVAGYVRSYARYLGMDAELVFQRFCDEAGFDGVNAGLTASKRSSSGRIVASGPVRAAKDDPILRPLRPAAELEPGFMDRMSLSAIGSVLVLVLLIGGLGYGGFAVLQNIQRVEITPVDQRPDTFAQVADFSLPVVDDGPGVDTDAAATSDVDLARLYQPKELEVPVVASRDGPIVDIDPMQAGIISVASAVMPDPAGPVREMDGLAGGELYPAVASAPVLREDGGVPKVNVVALRPAWIRVYQGNGTVLFEKILEGGETYSLPQDAEAPLLRAGNSGAVYIAINRETYGPLGTGTGVIKNVSLLPDDIRGQYARTTDVPEAIQQTVSALDLNVASR